MYAKIAKWISWALIIISVILIIIGFAGDFGEGAVDTVLKWAYVLFIAAVALIFILEIAVSVSNNPKSLVKMGIGLLAVVVVALLAYVTASGSELVGYLGTPPTKGTLKLADTLLNLVYLLAVVAFLSIIFGEILATVRNKK